MRACAGERAYRVNVLKYVLHIMHALMQCVQFFFVCVLLVCWLSDPISGWFSMVCNQVPPLPQTARRCLNRVCGLCTRVVCIDSHGCIASTTYRRQTVCEKEMVVAGGGVELAGSKGIENVLSVCVM